MKKIEAIVRPTKLNDIKDGLAKYGVKGMTVSEVVGCGLQKGQPYIYRGTQYNITLLPKVKIEVVVTDEILDGVIGVIVDNAKTGEVGDGKIFVTEVAQVHRIRTGETGKYAL